MFQESTTSPPDQSVTHLVSGIIDDAHELLRQQIALFKHEVQQDLKRAKKMSISFAASCIVCAVAGLMLSLMLVYLLSWAAPGLPLWVCFGIVAAAFAGMGAGLFFFGKEKLDEIVPPEESLKAMKENLQWTTKAK